MAASGLPVGNAVSRQLWEDCHPEAEQSLFHPFVQALARGTLPIDCFRHYVAQDAHFLRYFAKAYALALAQCTNHDDETFQSLAKLLRGVHTELELHASYAAQWNVSLDTMPSASTSVYCSFLIETAESGKVRYSPPGTHYFLTHPLFVGDAVTLDGCLMHCRGSRTS